MRLLFKGLSLLGLLAISLSTTAKTFEDQLYFQGTYEISEIEGYSQTPIGGMPGTSSFKQPRFKQGGISQAHPYRIQGGARMQDWTVFGRFLHLNPTGHRPLEHALITLGQHVPIGYPFHMGVDYKWWRLALGKRYSLYQSLECMPYLAVDYLRYQYQFSSQAPFGGHRKFSLMTGIFGIEFRTFLNDMFSLELKAAYSPWAFNLKTYEGQLSLKAHFFRHQKFQVHPFIGVGAYTLKHEDNQAIPNHLRYTAVPSGYIGVAFILTSKAHHM